MKCLIFILVYFFSINTFGQKKAVVDYIKREHLLKDRTIYLFGRGTRTKSALIAHQFNIIDTNITHVGIGFLENGQLNLYNVSDNNRGSALKIDSLESFIESPDVYYLEIWQLEITLDIFEKMANDCKRYAAKRIFFDNSFIIANDDSLYCSEFCAKVLESANRQDLSFVPRHFVLDNSFYEAFLERKILVYFPVDFFQENSFFSKIFEYRFREDF